MVYEPFAWNWLLVSDRFVAKLWIDIYIPPWNIYIPPKNGVQKGHSFSSLQLTTEVLLQSFAIHFGSVGRLRICLAQQRWWRWTPMRESWRHRRRHRSMVWGTMWCVSPAWRMVRRSGWNWCKSRIHGVITKVNFKSTTNLKRSQTKKKCRKIRWSRSILDVLGV